MTELADFLTLLHAGGDMAMIGLFFLMWKFDRRLVKIETIISSKIDEKI